MKTVMKQKWVLSAAAVAVFVTASAYAEETAAPSNPQAPVARKKHKKLIKKNLKEAAPAPVSQKAPAKGAAPSKIVAQNAALKAKSANRGSSDAIKTSASATASASEPVITHSAVYKTPTQSSTVNAAVPAASAPSPYSLKFASQWYGPSLASPLSAYQPTISGDAAGQSDKDSPVFSENVLTLTYKINDKWSLAPSFFFDTAIAGGKASTGKGMVGGDSPAFDLNDSFITLSNSSFFKKGNYNLAGYFRYYAPISQSSQAGNSLGMLQFLVDNSYDIPNSKWNLDFTAYARWYPRHNAPDGRWASRWYSGTSVNYKAASTFTLGLLYEAEMRTQYGVQADAAQAGGPDTFVAEATDFQPNFSWDISKKFNLAMWLNIPAGHDERRAPDTISIQGAVTVVFF